MTLSVGNIGDSVGIIREDYAGPKQRLSGPPSLVQVQRLHFARQGVSSPSK